MTWKCVGPALGHGRGLAETNRVPLRSVGADRDVVGGDHDAARLGLFARASLVKVRGCDHREQADGEADADRRQVDARGTIRCGRLAGRLAHGFVSSSWRSAEMSSRIWLLVSKSSKCR